MAGKGWILAKLILAEDKDRPGQSGIPWSVPGMRNLVRS